MPREEWLLAVRGRKRAGRCGCRSSRAPRGGLWSDMPHRDRSGRASWRIKGYTLASSGGDQWEWMHSAHKPQTLGQSQRLDLGGSRERCIASSRWWLWCHAWTGDKIETCSLPTPSFRQTTPWTNPRASSRSKFSAVQPVPLSHQRPDREEQPGRKSTLPILVLALCDIRKRRGFTLERKACAGPCTYIRS